MKKLPLLVLLVFGLNIYGFAQNRLIKGKVTDDHGKALAGASINIKNYYCFHINRFMPEIFSFRFRANGKAQF